MERQASLIKSKFQGLSILERYTIPATLEIRVRNFLSLSNTETLAGLQYITFNYSWHYPKIDMKFDPILT